MTQQKLNEYSMQHDQESQTVSQLRDQVGKLQEQMECIKDSKEFHDPDSLNREYVEPRNTREDVRNSGNVFARRLVRQDPEELCNDSRNLATSSRMHKKDRIEKGESGETATTIPMPCFPGRAREKSRDSGEYSLFCDK